MTSNGVKNRLLIITQKVNKNDSVLSFFHAWIAEFAKHFSRVTVVCLEEGEHSLPENVSVFSLGKEKGYSRGRKIHRFYTYIYGKRNEYDMVLVHMNPEYVVLGGLFWWLLRKPVYLWYTHKSVTPSLRIANFFVKKIFTASEESLRLKTLKKVVTGHGIDTNIFKADSKITRDEAFTLLSVGRISEAKGQDTIVHALKELLKTGVVARLVIVGEPAVRADKAFLKELKQIITDGSLESQVHFAGSVPNQKIVPYLQNADVLINESDTGSLDKVVLEAMACGTFVISSNDAGRSLLSKFNSHFATKHSSVSDLVENLTYLYKNRQDLHNLREKLRGEVVTNHNLEDLVLHLSHEISH